jgi:hypothetical protein
MLSELRKYKVEMILAHQHLAQISAQIQSAVLGNAGSIICFRLGAPDAQALEQEFAPEITALDLANLPNYHVYVKLLVGGSISRPFSGETLRLIP